MTKKYGISVTNKGEPVAGGFLEVDLTTGPVSVKFTPTGGEQKECTKVEWPLDSGDVRFVFTVEEGKNGKFTSGPAHAYQFKGTQTSNGSLNGQVNFPSASKTTEISRPRPDDDPDTWIATAIPEEESGANEKTYNTAAS
jgi:hypothetical protein